MSDTRKICRVLNQNIGIKLSIPGVSPCTKWLAELIRMLFYFLLRQRTNVSGLTDWHVSQYQRGRCILLVATNCLIFKVILTIFV